MTTYYRHTGYYFWRGGQMIFRLPENQKFRMDALNGIDTQFFGEYCQKRWFVYCNLIGLHFTYSAYSIYRAHIHGKYSEEFVMNHSKLTDYAKLPLHFPQVIRTYAYLAMMVGLYYFIQTKLKTGDSNPLNLNWYGSTFFGFSLDYALFFT